MKRFLLVVLTLVLLLCTAGCLYSQPDFKNFNEYNNDFVTVKDFVVDYYIAHKNTTTLIIDLDSQFLTIDGEEISDNTITDSVKAIYDKGFTYIEVEKNHIIFWEDETGYYGVLWSANPQSAIRQIVKSSRPYMKSRKLSEEWFEVGALDVI